ncbi:MAG: hypothetical protein ACTII7_13110 [Galactobacter sp.]
MHAHNATLAPAAFLGSVRPEPGSSSPAQRGLLPQQPKQQEKTKGFREPI